MANIKKDHVKGKSYRPIVVVEKVKNGIPTVISMSGGRRYILEHKDQHFKTK